MKTAIWNCLLAAISLELVLLYEVRVQLSSLSADVQDHFMVTSLTATETSTKAAKHNPHPEEDHPEVKVKKLIPSECDMDNFIEEPYRATTPMVALSTTISVKSPPLHKYVEDEPMGEWDPITSLLPAEYYEYDDTQDFYLERLFKLMTTTSSMPKFDEDYSMRELDKFTTIPLPNYDENYPTGKWDTILKHDEDDYMGEWSEMTPLPSPNYDHNYATGEWDTTPKYDEDNYMGEWGEMAPLPSRNYDNNIATGEWNTTPKYAEDNYMGEWGEITPLPSLNYDNNYATGEWNTAPKYDEDNYMGEWGEMTPLPSLNYDNNYATGEWDTAPKYDEDNYIGE